jgi:acyl-CoA reductase-like NAD-dependent aldehyde dehydrogenase
VLVGGEGHPEGLEAGYFVKPPVFINVKKTDDPQAPWGGFKYSGIGREYGRYGIEAFLEPRAILE